ncbi:hypothetical protein ASG29_06620 [Sphingomonas sp. Leaf412]|nr:hypothetical protein ASG29_06620 [Sphingomonas sp. Leaf412]
MHRLAEVYRDAAFRAAGAIQRGDPLTAAPLRLLALHSVELNLSAYLILKGGTAATIRRLGHDLGARLALATEAGLVLRRRTAAHVEAVARDREYLVARYGPELLGTVSQVNRLLATMEEVAGKVSRAFVCEIATVPSAIAPFDAASSAEGRVAGPAGAGPMSQTSLDR